MLDSILSNILIIDTETSGPSPYEHSLLSIAIVPYNQELPPLELFIKYKHKISWTDTAYSFFQKYEDRWNHEAVYPEVAEKIILEYLNKLPESEYILAGHNVGFDFSFLKKNLRSLGKLSHRSVDTYTILFNLCCKKIVPREALTSDGAFKYFNVMPPENFRHTALGDAIATKELLTKIIKL